jgi:hypothetical protein
MFQHIEEMLSVFDVLLLLAVGDLCSFNLLLRSLVECNALLGQGWSLFYGNI